MKNVSIYEKKWLDLVFEGKNKAYGAYQLRQETEKTSALAFIFGISFLSGFVFLLSSFTEKVIPVTEPVLPPIVLTHVDGYHPPTKPDNPAVKPPKVTEPVTKVEDQQGQFKVAKKEEAVDDVKRNDELKPMPVPTDIDGNTSGTAPYTGSNSGSSGGTATIPSVISTAPLSTKELDRQPDFPGGIKKFYQYVGENFDKDNIEEGQTVRITMSFVIEKNGAMTDIKVMEKANSTITKEAIRVLKSLKTKWSPGFKDGQPVRAYFTLPISVVI